MYAIIETCGKQYKVEKGDIVFFEKLDVEETKKIKFDKVILTSEKGKIQIGNPYLKDVIVEGNVISHGKDKKIIIFKYKPKKNYRKKQGHRQPYTKVEITEIKVKAEKVVKKEEPKEAVVKKIATKEAETKKIVTKKIETKKAETKKAETKKIVTKEVVKKEA